MGISAALHVALVASWFAPRALVQTPLAAKGPASSPARVQSRVQVRWVLPTASVTPVAAVPAVMARPARAVAVRPAPVAAEAPVPVAVSVPVMEDAPVAAAPPPTIVTPVTFAPPVFGGGPGRAGWGRKAAPSVDVAALMLAQQQRVQAAGLAQARAAVQDAEGRRLAAAATCDTAEDPSADPCRP